MKPGTLVVYPNAFGDGYLGRLNQPVNAFGQKRWTIDWSDRFVDDPTATYAEADLFKAVPQ